MEPITEKIEEQTKKGEKIDEHSEKQLVLMPDLIKFDELLMVPMLLDAPIQKDPEPKETITINVDKKIIKDLYGLKMPSELLGKSPEELNEIVDCLQQEQTQFTRREKALARAGKESFLEYERSHRVSNIEISQADFYKKNLKFSI